MNERTRQQAAKMGRKVHYRTYKVGKHWLVAGISSLALAGVLFGAGSTQASAATDGAVADDNAGQVSTAGDSLNQPEVTLTSTADTTAATSGSEMKADTGAVKAEAAAPEATPTEATTPETTTVATPTESEAPVAAEQTTPTADEHYVAVDDAQTYDLGNASDEAVAATKAQATQVYLATGQAQKITRTAAAVETGSVTVAAKTTDGDLIFSETIPVAIGQNFPLQNSGFNSQFDYLTQAMADQMKTVINDIQNDPDAIAQGYEAAIGDNIVGRYQLIDVTNDATGESVGNSYSLIYIDPSIKDYSFTMLLKKLPEPVVEHLYTDGTDATGATSSPKQIILTVADPVDDTTTKEESIAVTFVDDTHALLTSSKLSADVLDQIFNTTGLNQDGIQNIDSAAIQQSLRNSGIRMDGTVNFAADNLSPDITKVTYIYDKDAVTTPVTDKNQDMLDKLKDFYDQAMAEHGNDGVPPLPDGKRPTEDAKLAYVEVGFYVQNAETGEITPLELEGGAAITAGQLFDKDFTLPLQQQFSLDGVNYRYVGYKIKTTEQPVETTELNPATEIAIKGLSEQVMNDNGELEDVASSTVVKAVYEIVPTEITANYIYDDEAKTKIEPTQTVTPDENSDVTLPTTNLEKIILTGNTSENGVPTTLTLKFNSDFTVTHLILNEGTDREQILPAAYETVGAFLAGNVDDADLKQAILDGLAGDGVDENSTNQDVYQGFLANLAKTGIHINGNVAIPNPEVYGLLSDVTYVYTKAQPETDPGTTGGGTVTPGNPDVTQPTTSQPTVTQPTTEQPTVVTPADGETTPETVAPTTTEQPATGVKADGDDGETPETVAVSSNGTVQDDVTTTGEQAATGQLKGESTAAADAQRLPQTAEHQSQLGVVMGLALAGVMSLLGLSGLRKKRN